MPPGKKNVPPPNGIHFRFDHTTHNTQRTTHNAQRTTHNAQHTTHNAQHTTHIKNAQNKNVHIIYHIFLQMNLNANANANDSNINLAEVGINLVEMAKRFGEYFIENITAITTIIVIIIGALVYQQIMYVQHGIDGSKPINKKSQTVIVETFDNANADANADAADETNSNKMDSMLQAGFCKTHLGKPAELETACGELSKSSCTATSCCVWASLDSKESCMSGNQNGPIFKNGKTLDYYYFENKCSGNNCPGSAEK